MLLYGNTLPRQSSSKISIKIPPPIASQDTTRGRKSPENNVLTLCCNLHYEKFADGTVKCIEDEIPFELPASWNWCRLGVLFAHNTGKALNSSNTAGTNLTYITTSNLYWDRFELDNLKEMPFTESEVEKCTVKKGDLLVCEGGDIGRSAIWSFDEEIRIQKN